MALIDDTLRSDAADAAHPPLPSPSFDPLSEHTPHLSAKEIVTPEQERTLFVLAVAITAAAIMASHLVVTAVALVGGAIIVAMITLRYAAALAPRRVEGLSGNPDADDILPLYTILCPAYREARALPGLIEALDRLDYPRERLDVIVLTERGDAPTRSAVESSAKTRDWVRIIEAPAAGPKTKPKALNAGLAAARGDLLTVYDAEDRPDAKQLRAAAAAFANGDGRLACVQAPLAAYNGAEHWIAGQFALEYNIQFGYMMPLLARLGWPILLGGTSNHFRTSILRRHFGWDSYNVTEDADLGLRLARAGLRTGIIAPPTHEEAPIGLRAWRRQRTRWIKGHLVTWLVHMRRPGDLLRELGLWRFIGMQLSLGGGLLSSFVHGPLLILALAGLASGQRWETLTALLIGYGAAWACALRAASNDKDRRILTRALTAPLYWPLQSWAALCALWELPHAPHIWAKTEHGLTSEAAPLSETAR
jgi:glycosyltransferase XagB